MIENSTVTSVLAEKSEDQLLFDSVENFFANGQLSPEKLREYRKARNRIFAKQNEPMFCLSCKSFFPAGLLYLRAHRTIPNRIELICPLCYSPTAVLADKLAQLSSFRDFCERLKYANLGDVV